VNLGPTSLGLVLPLLLAATSAEAPGSAVQTSAEEPRPPPVETKLDVHSFKVVESYSGPVSYYRLIEDPEGAFIRAVYRPPLETVTLAVEVPDSLRQRTKTVRWKWRAQVLPKKGNECIPGFGDSAAVVYISWKRGLKWYSIKYVWSTEALKGAVCDQKRNLFVVQDTVVLESGGPTNVWKEEQSISAADYTGFVLVH